MITAFLPCRLGSQRIPDKNIKDFAGIKGGLLKIKLEQLCKTKVIDTIVVSSNDPRVLEFSSKFHDKRVLTIERPDYLGRNTTTTDELIKYVPTIINEGHVIWTHVTSPFLDETDYHDVIEKYFNVLNDGYDSLMTVLKIQSFLWNKTQAVNYNKDNLKWPMTQNLTPLYEVDSGAFISSVHNYNKFHDRIGCRPYLYEQKKSKSIDIDWPDDFILAEMLWKNNDVNRT
ncbi:acylneuraminate cytidylyltransferase family protein [Aeromonas veronii]|uniref:acylneuraminate cytidylyltransferase family protein n=1 Tax=Aeromonas veronii TaxID=654 RepID=UPI00214DC15D|nr:hypothetical protein [Aeromonas veronii]MCR3969094.1 hypothetical protein [Aeromonas veronii]MCR3981559.1 hypothetical protein [Aeromonas veronii]